MKQFINEFNLRVLFFFVILLVGFFIGVFYLNKGYMNSSQNIADTEIQESEFQDEHISEYNKQEIPSLTLTEDQKKNLRDFEEYTKKFNREHDQIPIAEIRKYYDKLGAKVIINTVEKDPYCHTKAHNVGRVIFEKTDNFNQALDICGYSCGAGCFHGVLMGLFQKKTDDHVSLDELESEIQSLCNDQKVSSTFIRGVCIHGVGHALTYLSNYNIGISLQKCELFGNKGDAYYCAAGVFMERDGIYGREDLKVSDAFPCDSYDFPAACFRYKLSTMFKQSEHKKALDFCLGINNLDVQHGCFHGLGFRFFKELNTGTATLDQVCDYGDNLDGRLCIEGAIGRLVIYNRSRAIQICNQQSGDKKNICNNAVSVGNYGNNRDFSLYYAKIRK